MRLNIKKGWFKSAGVQYHWLRDGYDIKGVGVAENLLRFNKTLEIVVEKKLYTLDTKEAIEFVKKYKTLQVFAGNNVWVVSKSLLKEVE